MVEWNFSIFFPAHNSRNKTFDPLRRPYSSFCKGYQFLAKDFMAFHVKRNILEFLSAGGGGECGYIFLNIFFILSIQKNTIYLFYYSKAHTED